jgi:predicted TIM-barrel fold metal-dependent hydrolase
MGNKALNRIKNQLAYLQKNKNNLVIDADTHISDTGNLAAHLKKKYAESPNYYHGRPISGEDLLGEMKMSGVDISLIWQNPAMTPYTDDKVQNFRLLLQANEYISDQALKNPEKFIPAGWTDPKALGLDNALKICDICIRELGFLIVKMNPAQNAFPIDSKDVFKIIERISELKGTVAFHYGADTPFTPSEGLEKIAKSFPETRIIGVHMGGGGAGYVEAEELYHKTRALGLNYKNLFFIQSAKRETHIESDFIAYTLAGEPFFKHIACASDAPYGRQTWNFGGYRLMFASLVNGESHSDLRVRKNPELFNTEMVKNYMGRNFAELVIEGYERMLN